MLSFHHNLLSIVLIRNRPQLRQFPLLPAPSKAREDVRLLLLGHFEVARRWTAAGFSLANRTDSSCNAAWPAVEAQMGDTASCLATDARDAQNWAWGTGRDIQMASVGCSSWPAAPGRRPLQLSAAAFRPSPTRRLATKNPETLIFRF